MATVKKEMDEVPRLRTRKRTRRTLEEIQKDVKRYNELLEQSKNLESDIPPRRSAIKQEEVKVDFKQLKSKKQLSTNISKPKPVLNRPKFMIENKKFPNKPKTSKNSPPKLSEMSSNKYEHRVLLENSYEDLISLVNSNINVKNPQESNIDIALHFNFVKKNLLHEKDRFQTEKPENDSSLLKYKSFNGDDIDMFFRNFNKLNGEQDIGDLRNIPLI
jgi:hypothetical protein